MANKIHMLIFCLISMYCSYADSIHRDLDLEKWTKNRLTNPKKVCNNCNFFIAFPLEIINHNVNIDMQTQNDNNMQSIQNESSYIYKLIFTANNIEEAYEEILRNKSAINCMYCGDLNKITLKLPKVELNTKLSNTTYHFTPMQDSYKIEIKDSICGAVDTLLFVKENNAVVLWVSSNLQCP